MTTPPAVYGQFGQALAFSERTMSAVLHDHLAQRGIEPGTWYALKLIATRRPGLSRQDLRRDLEESQNVATASVAGLLSHFDLDDIETTVRTLQAITRRAADEAGASADQPG